MKVPAVFGLVAFVILGTVSSKALNAELDIDDEWNVFKEVHNKVYGDDDEESFRKMVYMENKLIIDKHNELFENGEITFSMEMNEFGDLTRDEYIGRLNGYKPDFGDLIANRTFEKSENKTYPNEVDWKKKGYVTEVKYQGNCGSCWTFSTTGALEGQYFKKTGKLVSLSEQQLVDCSKKDYGCHGGWPVETYRYIMRNGGIESEKTYPYVGRERRCRYNKRKSVTTVSEYVQVESGDENLLAALADIGPVAVAIHASSNKFGFYKAGVFKEPGCSSTRMNHAVLVVGYGVADGDEPYWLVKNSWGTSWGDGGYIRMSRQQNNICGISVYGVYPVV